MIEFSEADMEAVMTVSYNGPQFDITAKGDSLSLRVLKSTGSNMVYTWNEDAEYPNQVRIHIREE